MRFLLYTLAGVLGGVLAGMGMGGGTLTMPILVLLLGVGQLTAQYANLIAFLPSGTSALGFHLKNGFIKWESLPPLLLPAALTCAITSFFATELDGELLRRLYGGFLTVLATLALTIKVLRKR